MTASLTGKTYQIFALAWRPTRLELWVLNNNGFTTSKPNGVLNIAVSEDERYYLLLRIPGSSQGWIRVPIGPRSLFARVGKGGNQFEIVAPVPGEGTLPLNAGRVHHNDLLSVIEGNRLHVFNIKEHWYERPLPAAIAVCDVSFDAAGGLWVAGSVSSARIPDSKSEIAIYYQSSTADRFEYRSPHLSFITAAKTIHAGGMESLRTIDARSELLVATSDCSWFIDDPSSFLFVRNDQQRWKVKRLAGRSVRRLLRFAPQMLVVVTVEGDIFALNTSGKVRLISKADDLRKMLLSHYPSVPTDARFIVRGADAKNGLLVMVAGLYVKTGRHLSWLVTAVCQSFDEGRTWEIAASSKSFDGDCELVDVAIFTDFPSD